jgi:hypothetical protein
MAGWRRRAGHNPAVGEVWRVAFGEGVRGGGALGAGVAVLAVLGLSPALRWIPDLPLLGAAVLLPVAAFAMTGHRAGRRSGSPAAGALAGGVAGAIAGGVAGLSYLLFGKPLLNLPVGLVLGAAGGAVLGAVAALVGGRTPRT